jgi:hypothetical protein
MVPRHGQIPIQMGNNTTIYAIGTGSKHFLIRHNSQILGLEIKALFAPQLRISLLSVGQLSQNHGISFVNGLCFITRQDGTKVVLGKLVNGFWVLTDDEELSELGKTIIPAWSQQKVSSLSATTPASIQPSPSSTKTAQTSLTLWHQHLGHLNYRATSSISGLSSKDASICLTCVQAKHKRTFQRSPVERTS